MCLPHALYLDLFNSPHSLQGVRTGDFYEYSILLGYDYFDHSFFQFYEYMDIYKLALYFVAFVYKNHFNQFYIFYCDDIINFILKIYLPIIIVTKNYYIVFVR